MGVSDLVKIWKNEECADQKFRTLRGFIDHERRVISARTDESYIWSLNMVAFCLIYIKFDFLQLILVNGLGLFVSLLPMLLKEYMQFVTVVRSWERPDPAGRSPELSDYFLINVDLHD